MLFFKWVTFWEKRGALIRGRRSFNLSRQKWGANSREVWLNTVYKCTYTIIYIYVCIYICVSIYVYKYMFAYVSLYTYTLIYIYIYVHIYVCAYICIHTYVYMHIYLLYIYVHIHRTYSKNIRRNEKFKTHKLKFHVFTVLHI